MKSSYNFGKLLHRFPGSHCGVGRGDTYNAEHALNLVHIATLPLAYFISSSHSENGTFCAWNKRLSTVVLQFRRPAALKPVKIYPFKGTLNIWCELNYPLRIVGVLLLYLHMSLYSIHPCYCQKSYMKFWQEHTMRQTQGLRTTDHPLGNI